MANTSASGNARKKRTTSKAGGAFGALNALSQTGALAAINSSAPPASAPPPTAPQESTSTVTVQTQTIEPAPAASAVVVPAAAPVVAEPTAAPATVVVPAQGQDRSKDDTSPEAGSEAPTGGPLAEEAMETPVFPGSAPRALAGSVDENVNQPVARKEESASVGSDSGRRVQVLEPEPPSTSLAVAAASASLRPATMPNFQSTSGYMQPRQSDGLPPLLAQKVDGLPQVYLLLANSYRLAKSARPGKGSRAKRNMRLHTEVVDSMTRRLLADKRLLGIRDLKPSHYVDAALTYARGADVSTLIEQADLFREHHLGEENGLEAPNHYSIAGENDAWLDDMIDELMVARANGLHGHMINVIIESFVRELGTPAQN